ncbi:ATP-binding cassette domain-containing protein [Thermophagus sp. OGC60D27]|uniref:ATP-binding cassette domain-containing protein n=1 Tax=Thermophagus sp. OGC60D27 TaxID=3458415 RepID=UPI0040383B37
MSEGILKALMQLFALIAVPVQDAESRRNIVRDYLSLHLNTQLIEEYLALFDQHCLTFQKKLKEKTRVPKLYAASSVKVLRIATAINEELTHYQKTIVIIQLLEFLNLRNWSISDFGNELADTVATTFNIPKDEYFSIKQFITRQPPDKNKNLLIIGGSKENRSEQRYLFREFLPADIYVLNIKSISLFLLKTSQNSQLTINGQVLIARRIQYLRPGGSIRYKNGSPITFSDIAAHFNYQANKTPIILDVRDVSFSFDKLGKAGLHPMSFTSHSGQLVGIMGDSGAGKSTLINLLTGIYLPASGEVLLNGIDLHLFPEKIKGLIGYVSQDDLLMEDLTVFQNLYYNTKLCYENLSNQEIHDKVDQMLKTLGLFEIKDMKVGSSLNKKISGGQRKRLNIALELVREPSVLFLDEPTSGLSSRDSENIIDLLKDMSVKGKLIFVVIHQPSSEIFKMFNQLLVLDTGGYLIYNGDPVGAINYFKSCVNHANRDENECPVCGNVNPEQILNIINSRVLDEYGTPTPVRRITPTEWFRIFKNAHPSPKKKEDTRLPLPDIEFRIPDRLGQFKVFFIRDLKSKLANLQYLLINLLEMPALALILAGMLFYFQVDESNGSYSLYNNPNLVTYIIITVIIAIFVGLTVSAEEIITDKKILRREAFLNLSRFSYLLSKVVILAIISAIQVFLLVWIGNKILQIEEMYGAYWIVLFSSAMFANLLGLIISDSLKKSVNIYILIPFLIIPQLVLSGVFVSYDRLNPKFSSISDIPWYGELITARWAFEALAVHQFKNNDYQREFYLYNQIKSDATYRINFWCPSMESELRKLEDSNGTNIDSTIVQLLNNEFAAIQPNLPDQLQSLAHTEIQNIPIKDNIDQARLYLSQIKKYFIALYNEADQRQDIHRQHIIQKYGKTYLSSLRDKYHNEALERFVRKKDDFFSKRIIRYNNRLIQKFDPIFRKPEHKFIKAHFLTSTKKIGQIHFDTFWVNVGVLWAMNVLLFLLLYHQILKKLLTMGKGIMQKF